MNYRNLAIFLFFICLGILCCLIYYLGYTNAIEYAFDNVTQYYNDNFLCISQVKEVNLTWAT